MVKILPSENFQLIYSRQRCFVMGDMRYVKILKQTPASQMYHFHTTMRPPAHWCKQGKKKGKQNGKGHWTDWLQYKQLLSIWSNSDFQLVLLFFLGTSVYIWVEKTLPEGSLSLNIVGCVLSSCLCLVSQAAQSSCACIALKLYNYQLQDFSRDFYNTHNCSEHRSPALN